MAMMASMVAVRTATGGGVRPGWTGGYRRPQHGGASMANHTLEQHLAAHREAEDPRRAAVAEIILALAEGAIAVRETVTLGALGAAFANHSCVSNGGGDMQKDLDVL